MKKYIRDACLLIASIISFAPATGAELITIRFEGTISETFGETWIASGFNVGKNYIAVYTFDPATPANNTTTMFGGIPPQRSAYPNALKSFWASSSGLTLTSTGDLQNGILIDDNLDRHDSYYALLASFDSELYLDLRSHNVSLFSNQTLPNTIPAASAFNYTTMFRVRRITPANGFSYASGKVDSISVVPEPSSLLLFSIGALAILGLTELNRHRPILFLPKYPCKQRNHGVRSLARLFHSASNAVTPQRTGWHKL